VSIRGRNFRVDHDDDGIRMENNMCQRCRCSSGQFEFCSRVNCPFVADAGTRSCEVDGDTIGHRDTFEDECNTCRCVNGVVRCTDRDCDDEDDDDDDDDGPDCSRMPFAPVCAADLRTYPSRCAAIQNDFEGFEIISGACTREVH